jgi:enterochelin esterase-like enzyme
MPARLFNRFKRFLLALGVALGLPGCRPAPTPTIPPITLTPASYAVTVEKIAGFESKALGNRRALSIYLPYDYAMADRRYPVLYVNDGQDMPLMKLAQTLETLYAEGQIDPIIVVAIPANADRLQEYGTLAAPNADGYGARAPHYAQFVTDEVIPAINTRYRVLTGSENTTIMGMSLGGLSAFDLAWHYPEVFGQVGVFSGSFWWRSAHGALEARLASRLAHSTVRNSDPRPGLRFWFEAGTRDETSDRDGNGVIDAIQDTTELMDELARKGYVNGGDMVYVEVEGGEHNPRTWGEVLPEFLMWAFGR